ncbi:MAG TPA: hypothetical protein H9873_05990, partial [Candidatus Dorea gallistercoris]|nr:hypothetical protein [Candidatus Dorea gallistercoris]
MGNTDKNADEIIEETMKEIYDDLDRDKVFEEEPDEDEASFQEEPETEQALTDTQSEDDLDLDDLED